MKQKLPTRRVREHRDLEQLKRQAKQLFSAFKAGDSAAVDEVNAHYDRARSASFALHDAQLVIARSYGFDSWPKLKAYVDGVTIRRLVEAVRDGHIEDVQIMLKARPELADMTVSYGDEHRAIHYAVMYRHAEIARLLMQNGANARAGIHPHRDATSAWTLARDRGYDEIVAIIEEEEGRRAKSIPGRATAPAPELGDEAERAAVANNDWQWLRARLAEGKLTNHVRWDDGGLLTVAIRNDRIEVLKFLLEAGFDPDERVSSGEGDWVAYSQGYPLWHSAAGNKDLDREGYLECFRLILNACDVNIVSGSGRTTLHEIAAMGNWISEDEVAAFGRAALEAGAHLDRRDDILSSTPLGWASRWGRVQLVKLFIQHGADSEENDAEE